MAKVQCHECGSRDAENSDGVVLVSFTQLSCIAVDIMCTKGVMYIIIAYTEFSNNSVLFN